MGDVLAGGAGARADRSGLEALASGASDPWLRRLLGDAATESVFRALENELFLAFGDQRVSLVVTSAGPREGRTSVAVLLASSSAVHRPERRVLLVDADLARGDAGRQIGVQAGPPGLGDFMDGRCAPLDAIRRTSLPNLDVAVAGVDGGRGRRFSPSAFERFVAEATGAYDLVIVDGPPAGGHREVASMAKVVGSVLLVVRCGGPAREQILAVLRELERVGARMLGVLLNEREYPVPPRFYGAR